MNKGIDVAKGELIGMINSDDWYEPNAVELMVIVSNDNPTKTIFHGDRNDILSNGTRQIRKFNPSVIKFIYYGMTYNHPSMFIAKELYNVNLKALSDYQFVLRAFLENKSKFYYLDISIVNYRLDGISAQISFSDRLKEGFTARQRAGLGFIRNLISLIFRFTVLSFHKWSSFFKI
jgi:hypothetical protein